MRTARYRHDYPGFVADEDYRVQRLRNNWDPFDPLEKIDRDGVKARNGTWFNPSEDRRIALEQVEKGEFRLPRATKKSTDIVYFIQGAGGGPVKIGHSTQGAVAKRLKALQTGHYEHLEVRGLFDGGTWLEHALHVLFDDYRIRGEWFAVSPLMQKLCPEVI